jgi:hypothetical protein
MNDDTEVVSKVLILEDDKPSRDAIRKFCELHNLVTVRAKAEHVMTVLQSNVDLGGIFLAEEFDGKAHGGIKLARRIHAIRPELPIFLRRDALADFEGISESDQMSFTAAYVTEDMEALTPDIDRTIFSLTYPNALVRGITEITKAALESQFKDLDTQVEKPYVVKDRLIYGEIYTLIPVRLCSWSRLTKHMWTQRARATSATSMVYWERSRISSGVPSRIAISLVTAKPCMPARCPLSSTTCTATSRLVRTIRSCALNTP